MKIEIIQEILNSSENILSNLNTKAADNLLALTTIAKILNLLEAHPDINAPILFYKTKVIYGLCALMNDRYQLARKLIFPLTQEYSKKIHLHCYLAEIEFHRGNYNSALESAKIAHSLLQPAQEKDIENIDCLISIITDVKNRRTKKSNFPSQKDKIRLIIANFFKEILEFNYFSISTPIYFINNAVSVLNTCLHYQDVINSYLANITETARRELQWLPDFDNFNKKYSLKAFLEEYNQQLILASTYNFNLSFEKQLRAYGIKALNLIQNILNPQLSNLTAILDDIKNKMVFYTYVAPSLLPVVITPSIQTLPMQSFWSSPGRIKSPPPGSKPNSGFEPSLEITNNIAVETPTTRKKPNSGIDYLQYSDNETYFKPINLTHQL